MRRPAHLPTRSFLWLRIACLWLLGLALPTGAENALESLKLPDGTILLNGVGVARQLNEELYVATLYASRPSRHPAELLDARQRRHLELRILADRLYPSGVARHFRDLVSLNNPRDEITREAKNLNRFYGLFQHGLMRGDALILDNVTGKQLQVLINSQPVAEFSSPLLFDLLLRCFIGDKPPNLLFRNHLLGDLDGASRTDNLLRFAALRPHEERLLIYAGVKAPASGSSSADTVVALQPAPAPPAASKPSPERATVSKSAVKPEPLAPSRATPAPVVTAIAASTTASTAPAKVAPAQPGSAVNMAAERTVAPSTLPAKKTLSSDEISALLQRYESQLKARLVAELEYPRRDLKRKYGITQMARQKGTVVLRLHLDTGGDINAAWLQERTNEPILDNAALALVDKVAPFPPLPPELPDSAYEFYVALEFDPDR